MFLLLGTQLSFGPQVRVIRDLLSVLFDTSSDRGLSLDSIQEELEDELLQFKGPMIRARSKRLENQIYSRLLMLGNLKDIKIMTWSTFEG